METLKARIEEEAYQRMVYNVNFNSNLRENSGTKSTSLAECKNCLFYFTNLLIIFINLSF